MSRQLAFDLPLETGFRREDFFATAANAQALAAVEDWRNWPGGKLILVGPMGSGKTHLAHVWADMAGAEVVSARRLAERDLPDLARGPVVVEDVEAIAGNREAETALFHLHNMNAGQNPENRGLLLTANHAPRDWGLCLPDLLSRVQAAGVARLDPPDEALLSVVLVKLFADRQITVPPNLISYLVPRMDRSLFAAAEWVKFLDARALALGRPITRALAAEVLDLGDLE